MCPVKPCIPRGGRDGDRNLRAIIILTGGSSEITTAASAAVVAKSSGYMSHTHTHTQNTRTHTHIIYLHPLYIRTGLSTAALIIIKERSRIEIVSEHRMYMLPGWKKNRIQHKKSIRKDYRVGTLFTYNISWQLFLSIYILNII